MNFRKLCLAFFIRSEEFFGGENYETISKISFLNPYRTEKRVPYRTAAAFRSHCAALEFSINSRCMKTSLNYFSKSTVSWNIYIYIINWSKNLSLNTTLSFFCDEIDIWLYTFVLLYLIAYWDSNFFENKNFSLFPRSFYIFLVFRISISWIQILFVLLI